MDYRVIIYRSSIRTTLNMGDFKKAAHIQPRVSPLMVSRQSSSYACIASTFIPRSYAIINAATENSTAAASRTRAESVYLPVTPTWHHCLAVPPIVSTGNRGIKIKGSVQ